MKPAIFLALFALPAAAQILASFEIVETPAGNPLGNVVVELQYDKTPRTVANFIALAEGSRPCYDDATGAVRPKRFYTGEPFYRVVNDSGFKIAQTGSGNGTNSGGGPGYKFRDEFHPDLRHDPYVLAMANSGPNTNGSQIYLTGSAAIPSLDGKHTVFGLVTDAASRATIDLIMAAGTNATRIGNLVIQRNGPDALDFDESGQNLPVCQAVPGVLSVDASGGMHEVSYTPAISVTGDSIFTVFKSTDLSSWDFIGRLPPGSPLTQGTPISFPVAEEPKAFYHISLLRNPDALRQELLAGKTMALNFAGGIAYTLTFGSGGTSGTLVVSSNPGQSFPFQLVQHEPDAYGAVLVVNLFPYPALRIVAGYDTADETQIMGRHSTSQWNGANWVPAGDGALTLSK
ncbi:MAG: peptidylprolyl isomerase [Luteolibacter sp.]